MNISHTFSVWVPTTPRLLNLFESLAADMMNDSSNPVSCRVEACCYFTVIRCTIFTVESYKPEYHRDLTPDRKNGVLKAFDGHWKSDLMNFNGGMLPWLLSYLRAVQCSLCNHFTSVQCVIVWCVWDFREESTVTITVTWEEFRGHGQLSPPVTAYSEQQPFIWFNNTNTVFITLKETLHYLSCLSWKLVSATE